MSRTPPRQFTVLDKTEITPHMLRITLGGAGMVDFPADQASAYVKLRFAQAHSDRPLLRTYTVRSQREDAIDIDFVLHHDGGPASRWADQATPGDTIEIGGPGPAKRVDPRADWFLLVGDMTALPAISANLETLPANARGRAVIEVIERADIQDLHAPEGIQLDWVINARPGRDSDVLCEAVRALNWAAGRPSIWVACEFASMRKLRAHLKDERGVAKEDLYISSYWKLGSNEERHKVEKREDAESAGA